MRQTELNWTGKARCWCRWWWRRYVGMYACLRVYACLCVCARCGLSERRHSCCCYCRWLLISAVTRGVIIQRGKYALLTKTKGKTNTTYTRTTKDRKQNTRTSKRPKRQHEMKSARRRSKESSVRSFVCACLHVCARVRIVPKAKPNNRQAHQKTKKVHFVHFILRWKCNNK